MKVLKYSVTGDSYAIYLTTNKIVYESKVKLGNRFVALVDEYPEVSVTSTRIPDNMLFGTTPTLFSQEQLAEILLMGYTTPISKETGNFMVCLSETKYRR